MSSKTADVAFISIMKLLPKSAMSRAVGSMTRMGAPKSVHRLAIRSFAKLYGIATEEAERGLDEYENFGAFFTRRLKEGLRPIAAGDEVVVSPVDGTVAGLGFASEGRMLQAKGRDYTLAALLDDPEEAKRFEGGAWIVLYLSPRDYHRIHAPLAGTIERYSYIPGKLFPVNGPAVREVPNLFCVNERLISYLVTPAGRVAVVKVGATCVGRIRLSYDSIATNDGLPASAKSFEPPRAIEKGAELGLFEMGSTVVLLFEPGRVELNESLAREPRVKMGCAIGRCAAPGRD